MKTIEREYAVAMPLDPQNRILLQNKDSGYVFWPNYWCTFGGGMGAGEEPRITLAREVREENGLVLSDVRLFDSREFEDYSQFGEEITRRGLVHYFEARFDGDLSKIALREGGGFKLFEEEELARYNELELVVPYNYAVIKDFYDCLRGV